MVVNLTPSILNLAFPIKRLTYIYQQLMILLIPAVVVQPSEITLVFDFDLNAFYRKNSPLPLNSSLRNDIIVANNSYYPRSL